MGLMKISNLRQVVGWQMTLPNNHEEKKHGFKQYYDVKSFLFKIFKKIATVNFTSVKKLLTITTRSVL